MPCQRFFLMMMMMMRQQDVPVLVHRSACGNTSSQSQVITVQDTTDPVLFGVPPDATAECDNISPPASPTASDNCDPDPIISFDEVRTDGDCPDNYVLARTWTATVLGASLSIFDITKHHRSFSRKETLHVPSMFRSAVCAIAGIFLGALRCRFTLIEGSS